MQCGLFGKLAAKRDFITLSVPRAFLQIWEPWLDRGLARSRTELDSVWEATFREAPIWRFWLGSGLCGSGVLGALMPSMDAIGRYFPLTFICLAEQGKALEYPARAPHHAWFEKVEDLLLATLDPQRPFEATTQALASFAPAYETAEVETGGDEPVYVAVMSDSAQKQPLSAAFNAEAEGEQKASVTTFWWTAGGAHYPASAWCQTEMPEPFLFTGMLTGDFDCRRQSTLHSG